MSANAVAGEALSSPARPAKRKSPAPRHATIYDAFDALTEQLPGNDGCLQWRNRGAQRRYAYPVIYFRGSRYKATHLAWILANGEDIPAGLNVNHRCDNTYCVRADHLMLGTQRENMTDMYCRQRWGANAKLSWEKAQFIREYTDVPGTQIAKVLGVTPESVYNVRRGKTWVPRCTEVSDK